MGSSDKQGDEVGSTAKKESALSIDSSGKLRTESKVDARVETTTELVLQLAMQRRGVAMEMANILDFNLHTAWVERLLSARLDSVKAHRRFYIPAWFCVQAVQGLGFWVGALAHFRLACKSSALLQHFRLLACAE